MVTTAVATFDVGQLWIGVALVIVTVLIPSLAAFYRLGKMEQKVEDVRADVGELKADVKALTKH